jgi:hypothetical protein
MLFDYPVLAAVEIFWAVFSLSWMMRRNDEVPLLIASLIFYVSGFRYWSVTHGLTDWADITPFGFERIRDSKALDALGCIVLGESLLLITYTLTQRAHIDFRVAELPASFASWLRPKLFILGFASIPLVWITRQRVGSAAAAGVSLGFEVSSYVYLFPYVVVGVGLLTFLLWRFGAMTDPGHQLITIGLIVTLFFLSYSPASRFQLLGWLVGGIVILSTGLPPGARLVRLIWGGVAVVVLFAAAGSLRTITAEEPDSKESITDRILRAEDGNMLDGFVLLQQVYPDRLEFRRGQEHLGILCRPVPRKWWPGKPVGGYMNRLGLITADSHFTLGISPTLFGSFYEEGGVAGMVICSILYGIGFAKLTRFSLSVHPFAGVLIRTMFCAGLIPLLRGGDLPGIYAWFGMAFWPCGLLLYLRKHELMVRQTFD